MSLSSVDEFLKLKCCPDILSVCSPMNNSCKEISETMTVIRLLRSLSLKNPMKYNILDLCAGNAWTSITSACLLPVDYVVAVDKRERFRKWENIRRFQYITKDILQESLSEYINENTIIISVHPCGKLAERIIEIFNDNPAKALYLMPCCGRSITTDFSNNSNLNNIIDKFVPNSYVKWCLYLYTLIREDYSINLHEYKKCLTPKNIIISAIKEKS